LLQIVAAPLVLIPLRVGRLFGPAQVPGFDPSLLVLIPLRVGRLFGPCAITQRS